MEKNTMKEKPVMVLAIGGNALIPDNNHLDMQSQRDIAAKLAKNIVDLSEEGWRVVLTHGNGPHVGIHQSQGEAAKDKLPQYPLDHYVSATQGEIGYLLQSAIYNELMQRKINQQVATLITQVVVDPKDQAFTHPDKPVGVFLSEAEAKQYEKELGWSVVEDSGRGWRRVVASPKPKQILELKMIEELIGNDVLVISCGGGGIPVMIDDKGQLQGVEAVIDKDRASSLLASALKADVYLIPTGVEKIAINFGKPNQEWLSEMTVAEAKAYMEEGQFPAGSMLPKVESLLDYLKENPKGAGIVTTLDAMADALRGKTGTRIVV